MWQSVVESHILLRDAQAWEPRLAGTGSQGALRSPLIRPRFLGHCYPCSLRAAGAPWAPLCPIAGRQPSAEAGGTQQGGCQLSDSGGRRARDRSTASAQRGEGPLLQGRPESGGRMRARSTPLIREGRGAGSEALTPKGVWLLPRRSSGKFKVLGPIPPLRGGASSKHRRHFQLPFAEGCSSERTSHSLPLTRISAS